MRQIIIRMFVALIMCGVTSVIRFGSLMAAPQVGTQTVWILRLITASLLSPLLYSFISGRTSNWTIRLKHRPHGLDDPSVLSIQPSAFDLINRPSRLREILTRRDAGHPGN